MAVRGRKPKPTAIKIFEGNRSRRPLNEKEPKPPEGMPACPAWLETEAKREWQRLAKIMAQMGILSLVDRAAFATYCQAYARWKEAEEYISKNGSTKETSTGYIQQIPQVSIAQTYSKIMAKIAAEFGLTPASRSRITAGEMNGIGKVISKKKDAMDELLESGS